MEGIEFRLDLATLKNGDLEIFDYAEPKEFIVQKGKAKEVGKEE